MKYNRLGNTGLIVSKYCWGAANLGTPLPMFAASPHFDEAQAREATAIALDHGVNFFDTADLYSNGGAEEILGRCLKGHRDDVVISSKVGIRTGEAILRAGLSKRHLLHSIDGTLRRLGTDWLDVYIVHKPDPLTPLEETLETLDRIVRDGKARYLGYSNWPDWMVAKAVEIQKANGWARFSTGQLYYSLIGRELEEATIPMCRDLGIGIMAWSPLAGGYLTGKYTLENRKGDGKLNQFSFVPIDRNYADQVVVRLDEIAQKHGTTPANVAFAWVAEQQAVSTVLLGVTRVTQLAENLAAAQLQLDQEDLASLTSASAFAPSYPHWYNQMMIDPATVGIG